MCIRDRGDEVNPDKASSGCQFYIVTGKVYNDSTVLVIILAHLVDFLHVFLRQRVESIVQAHLIHLPVSYTHLICFVRIETNLSDCSINFFNVL